MQVCSLRQKVHMYGLQHCSSLEMLEIGIKLVLLGNKCSNSAKKTANSAKIRRNTINDHVALTCAVRILFTRFSLKCFSYVTLRNTNGILDKQVIKICVAIVLPLISWMLSENVKPNFIRLETRLYKYTSQVTNPNFTSGFFVVQFSSNALRLHLY